MINSIACCIFPCKSKIRVRYRNVETKEGRAIKYTRYEEEAIRLLYSLKKYVRLPVYAFPTEIIPTSFEKILYQLASPPPETWKHTELKTPYFGRILAGNHLSALPERTFVHMDLSLLWLKETPNLFAPPPPSGHALVITDPVSAEIKDDYSNVDASLFLLHKEDYKDYYNFVTSKHDLEVVDPDLYENNLWIEFLKESGLKLLNIAERIKFGVVHYSNDSNKYTRNLLNIIKEKTYDVIITEHI